MLTNPDTDYFERHCPGEDFEVDEVVDVRDVRIVYDARTREAAIHYVALTDYETIKEEVKIRCRTME